ncbi:putative (Iso)eugenol O-methyltransferase [Dioscorea sansibarensis]
MHPLTQLHKNFAKLKTIITMATPIKKQEFTAEELLQAQAQAQVFHHVYGQIGAMSLNCAIELDIPGIIAKHGGEPMPLSNLMSSLPISAKKAPFLPRLMRILTHMGYFVQETASDRKEVAYSLTPLSKVLLKDSPTSLSSWVMGMLHPYARVSWHRLSDWFLEKRYETPCELEHGKTIWDLASEMPYYNRRFDTIKFGFDTMKIDRKIIM